MCHVSWCRNWGMLNTFLEKTAAVDVKRSPSSSLLDMMWFYNLVTFSRHRRRDSFHRTIKDCNVFGVLFIYSVYVFWRSFWKCFPRKKKIARFFSHIEIRRWTILQMSFYLGCWVIKESERRNKWHQRLILSLLEFSLSLSYHES